MKRCRLDEHKTCQYVNKEVHTSQSHIACRELIQNGNNKVIPVLMVSLARMAAAKLSPSIPTAMMTTRSERLV